MSHEVFGERFLGKREPAWHGLGQTFDAPIGALEAIETGGMDFEVSLEPIRVRLGSEYKAVDDKVAIVRHPTDDDNRYRVFGYASPNYGLLQNRTIGEILDPLTEQWPIETVGALKLGKTLFLTMKAGSQDVAGDPVEQYFLFTDTKTGSKAAQFAFTPVRVVCQNTLTLGLGQAVITATLPHHEDVQDELDWRVALLSQMQEAQVLAMTNFDQMAAAQLNSVQVNRIFNAAYPYPTKPRKLEIAEALAEDDDLRFDADDAKSWLKLVVDRAEKRREAVKEVYAKFNDEITPKALSGTAWAAYNSVVEWEDFRGKETEGSLYAALFGERARNKKAAFAEAVKIAQS
jgi:phage/plasmid-like protein (TIGR03299 family)